MLLNRAFFLPLLLAGCAAPDDTANADQDSRLEELELRVSELESQADTAEENMRKVAAAAAVGFQGAAVTAPVALGTDRAFDRIKKLEAAERERGVKEADAAFKDAVAK